MLYIGLMTTEQKPVLADVELAATTPDPDPMPKMPPIPKGPWTDEPNRLEWKHAGYHCLITRSETGHYLCGYLAVPPGHPWHGVGYDEVTDAAGDHPDVHGGLTYASPCFGKVCHVPEPGEPDDVWWLGIDCAHYRDLQPQMLAWRELWNEKWPAQLAAGFDLHGGDVYRDIGYVTGEMNRLAEAAAEVQRCAR